MTPELQPLAGIRVLVTRPAHQAAAICQALTDSGAEAIAFPTLDIQQVDDYSDNLPLLNNTFLNLDLYHAVIFVSANAARTGHDWIDRYWPQLPVGVHWLAVGKATANTLKALQIEVLFPEKGMDSEALLELTELNDVTSKRILICRGEGGRECLAEILTSRGAKVDYAELYRRTKPVYAEQDIESIIYKNLPSVMLVTSNESLNNLDQLCQGQQTPLPITQLRKIPVVVPSQRVAETAGQLGYSTVIVADNATDSAMIAAIQLNL
ncbi:MAG: uroporphyrinogen-III synthase [Motiliproteus sp.]